MDIAVALLLTLVIGTIAVVGMAISAALIDLTLSRRLAQIKAHQEAPTPLLWIEERAQPTSGSNQHQPEGHTSK